MGFENDPRVVLTLDAGGTNFVFSAVRGNREILEPIRLPSRADDLTACLATLEEGFSLAWARVSPPAAISFAFPGPADYPQGIIGDLGNLPAFRGGVALGPILEERFRVPVFINNDGDLFTYGESICGLLPQVNALLAQHGSRKRYRNLFGVTLGTGFGAGIVTAGRLFVGDNSAAAEIWLERNKLDADSPAEEGVSIRAVRREYAGRAGIDPATSPEPKEIYAISKGEIPGDRAAAIEAFRRLGEIAGDAIANAATLIDGLVVIGGGLAGASSAFLPALIAELNSTMTIPGGGTVSRLGARVFNLEDAADTQEFLQGEQRSIQIPGTDRTVLYDPLQRIGVGLSRLGTSAAVSVGAYAFALAALDTR